ncbi:MAG: hypothetical protein EPN85_00315 [Bacteroidetes bacterium]|nr:MAG: hypothetical protein EPN85_00315 [Bacteroidota bacterium]
MGKKKVYEDLTIGSVKSFPGIENISDEEAAIAWSLYSCNAINRVIYMFLDWLKFQYLVIIGLKFGQ